VAPTTATRDPSADATFAPTFFEDRIWKQVGSSIKGESLSDETGFSVSMSNNGQRVAIGSKLNSNGGITNRGNVLIYDFNATLGDWVSIMEFFGDLEREQYGFDVALSGDGTRVAIGAVGYRVSGKSNTGRIEVYEERLSSWELVGELVGENEGDLFGFSVSLSLDGNVVGAGAPYHAAGGIYRTGRAYVFQDEGNNLWSQLGSPISGTTNEDYLGWSVALSQNGLVLATGAPLSSGRVNDPGYVVVHKYFPTVDVWDQIGPALVGGEDGDRFGFSTSIAKEGDLVGVGAFRSSPNGSDSGLAAVYENDGMWTQKGDTLIGSEEDQFGFSVSLSPDGTQFVVSGPKAKNDASDATGLVRIFRMVESNWTSSQELRSNESSNFGFSVATSAGGSNVVVGVLGLSEARVFG